MNVRMFQSMRQFSCNVYVVSSDRGNILIDPGHYDQDIKKHLQQIGGLDAILLTHGHWDHTYGLDSLKRDFPNAQVYMPEDGQDFLQNPDLNGSSLNGFSLYVNSHVNSLKEGKTHIAGYDIDVINTPGHCRGCAIYYLRNVNILFTGDTIMRDVASPIRMSGSKESQRKSIRKIMNLGYKNDTPVYPGHGESTTYGFLMKNNIEVREARK